MPSTESPARPRSHNAFTRAQEVLVGGVNSPVRAFRAVGGRPVFLDSAKGAYVADVDGNRYVDLVGTWGPAIVGHAHPEVVAAVQQAAAKGLSFGACCEAEAELGELIVSALPGMEMIRFVNSGTEATMSALRLIRAATGRSKVVKFLGCYHGHVDSLLVAAGSGAATFGTPDSAGVPAEVAADTLLAPYNDLAAVEKLFAEYEGQIAGILVEPIAGNMNYVLPQDGFLEGLRSLCDTHGSLLVFDEVMTGFRVAWGGYQVVCGIQPDVTCLGKVVGGGLPVAAYGASREIMNNVSPLGPMYQAGTLSGNPLGMACGIATLNLCQQDGFYDRLGAQTTKLARALKTAADAAGVPLQTDSLGGMMGVAFADAPLTDYDDAAAQNHDGFHNFFQAMLDRGVWLPPSSYEAMFVSAAHDDEAIEHIAKAAQESFEVIHS
ncbi:MAG: glutamate-1-semialdehyde 2,1-aminomutase [Phycisphaerales bacterium JB038]